MVNNKRKTNFAVFLAATSFFFAGVAPAGRSNETPKRRPSPAIGAIRTLQPKLTGQKAARLAYIFESAASDCNIPWQLLVSIAFHESSLGYNLVNARTHDFGIMQVNSKTSLRYGLSQDRLLKDEAYSLAAACRVLADNKARYAKHLPYWLGIYRSGTRLNDPRIRENAKQYDHMIRLTAASIGYR
jgi:hypothetical protein